MSYLHDDDELTEADLAFLNQWENLGKTDEELAEDDRQVNENLENTYVSPDASVGPVENPPPPINTEITNVDDDDSDDDTVEEAEIQIETDDGPGPRNNSDEQRQSDEPITSSDPEADEEPSENLNPEAQLEPAENLNQEANEAPAEQDDSADTPENEVEFDYEHLPEADSRCENHCEDNTDDESDGEPCQHCIERIRMEREQWGVVAKDRNGAELLPGDKVIVVVPTPLVQVDAILAVNVPNETLERIAIATAGTEHPEFCWLSGRNISQFTGYHLKSDGPIWTFPLGKVIKFVEKIAEPRQYEPKEPNSEHQEMAEADSDKMIDDIQDFLNSPNPPVYEDDEPEPEIEEDEHVEVRDSDPLDNIASLDEAEDEMETHSPPEVCNARHDFDKNHAVFCAKIKGHKGPHSNSSNITWTWENTDEPEAEPEEPSESDSKPLTQTQIKRFENLFGRVEKKVEGTFGQTVNEKKIEDDAHISPDGSNIARQMVIKSNGVSYLVVFMASRDQG